MIKWQLAQSLAHHASKNEELIAKKENLLVPDDKAELFSSPTHVSLTCQTPVDPISVWSISPPVY